MLPSEGADRSAVDSLGAENVTEARIFFHFGLFNKPQVLVATVLGNMDLTHSSVFTSPLGHSLTIPRTCMTTVQGEWTLLGLRHLPGEPACQARGKSDILHPCSAQQALSRGGLC